MNIMEGKKNEVARHEPEIEHKNGVSNSNGVNWEITEKLKKDPKAIAFNKWARENGAIFPRVIRFLRVQ